MASVSSVSGVRPASVRAASVGRPGALVRTVVVPMMGVAAAPTFAGWR